MLLDKLNNGRLKQALLPLKRQLRMDLIIRGPLFGAGN
jgi:hypothetical protein